MKTYENQPSGTIDGARELRRDSTDAKKRLLRGLRDNFGSHKFRRQMPLGPYFPDITCFAARLVIEVDGGQHAAANNADAARTRFIEREGFRVLRFWNSDVIDNLDGVLGTIDAARRQSLPSGERRSKGGHLSEHATPSPFRAAPSLSLPVGEGS